MKEQWTAGLDDAGRPVGIFTDGDLRRLIEKQTDLQRVVAHAVMHAHPRTVAPDALAVEAAELMEAHRINSPYILEGSDKSFLEKLK